MYPWWAATSTEYDAGNHLPPENLYCIICRVKSRWRRCYPQFLLGADWSDGMPRPDYARPLHIAWFCIRYMLGFRVVWPGKFSGQDGTSGVRWTSQYICVPHLTMDATKRYHSSSLCTNHCVWRGPLHRASCEENTCMEYICVIQFRHRAYKAHYCSLFSIYRLR